MTDRAHLAEVQQALRVSEERFRLLVESVRDCAIFMLDAQGYVSTWNQGANRITGYAAHEILGQHVSRFYPEADLAGGKPAHELEAAAAHGRFEDEGWRVRKDGSRFWANVVITALRDDTGQLVGFAKVTRDLTERRRAEEERIRLICERAARVEAQAGQRRAALLAEASRLLPMTLDDESMLAAVARLAVPAAADVCIVQVLEGGHNGNAMALRTAAVHAEPTLALPLDALPPEPFDPDGPHPIAAALRSGRVGLVADLRVVPEGALGRVLRESAVQRLLVAPVLTSGRVHGVLVLGFAHPDAGRPGAGDVVFADQLAGRVGLALENARLYRDVQAAVRDRQEALQARDVFLARASHELRTPLTAAFGTMRLLKAAIAGRLAQRPDELLDIALRSLEVLRALVDDLLDASALEARELLEREPIDLTELVRETLDVARAEARQRGVRLEAGVERDVVLSADRLKLEQVLINLLANGIKFTPPGGEVRVEVERHDDQARVRVRDTGQGISSEYLEAIFEPFYQIKQAGARRSRGTGLGLAICRRIVTLHGGRIWAESGGPGQGACLVVELPLQPAERRAA